MILQPQSPPFRRAGIRVRIRGQAGGLTFSGVLLILVVVAILFAAFKLLPPYIDNYRFQDSLNNITRNSTYGSRVTVDDIRRQVMTEVRVLGLPIQENQVTVQRTGVSVDIAVSYSVPVDLLVHQMVLNFEPAAGNRNITARP